MSRIATSLASFSWARSAMRMACSSGVSGSKTPWIRPSQSSVPRRRRREGRHRSSGGRPGRSAPRAVPELLLHHRAARAARLGGDILVRSLILSLVLAGTRPDRELPGLFRSEEAALDQRHAYVYTVFVAPMRDAPVEGHELLAEPPGVVVVARDPIHFLAFSHEVLVDGALGRVLVAIPGPGRAGGEEQRQHEGDGDDAGPGHSDVPVETELLDQLGDGRRDEIFDRLASRHERADLSGRDWQG